MPTAPAPRGLGPSGRAVWRAVLADFDLDNHELLLLKEAARTADRCDRLEAAAAAGPLTVRNRFGDEVVHPCMIEARQAALTMARLLAVLQMPRGDEGARPQRRGGARGVYRNTAGLGAVRDA